MNHLFLSNHTSPKQGHIFNDHLLGLTVEPEACSPQRNESEMLLVKMHQLRFLRISRNFCYMFLAFKKKTHLVISQPDVSSPSTGITTMEEFFVTPNRMNFHARLCEVSSCESAEPKGCLCSVLTTHGCVANNSKKNLDLFPSTFSPFLGRKFPHI